MSLSRVDLPDPFTPISPVRPGPNDTVRPDSTDAPSGQLKLRSEQTIAAVMRRGSQHVGKIPVRVATPRRVGSEHLSSGRGHAHKRGIADLTASTHSPTADSRDASMLARPLAHANRIRDMIVGDRSDRLAAFAMSRAYPWDRAVRSHGCFPAPGTVVTVVHARSSVI